MLFNRFKNYAMLFLFLYLFTFIYPALTNPFIAINLLNAFLVLIISLIFLAIVYVIIFKNKFNLDEKVKSNILTIFLVILALFLYNNPFPTFVNYNYYPPRFLCIILLLALIFYILDEYKNGNDTFLLALIIFIPGLIQSVLMSFKKTIIIYLYYPHLTTFLYILMLGLYYFYMKKKK